MAIGIVKQSREPYSRIPDRVLYHKKLNGNDHKVYAYINNISYYADSDVVIVSNQEISKKTGTDTSTASRSIQRLSRHGVIEIEQSRTKKCGIHSTLRKIRVLIQPK